MIRRILHVARREWREQVRQPAMLGVVSALFFAIAGLVVAALLILDTIAAQPDRAEALTAWFPGWAVDGGSAVEAFAGFVVAVATWLVFTQLLGIVAVLAGHAVLHDRQVGTLPFLLLAPLRRIELLTGKVLGVLVPPLVPYLVLSGGASAIAASLPVSTPHAATLPPSPAWMIAFFVGGPVWAAFVATICAIVSSLSHDVRTAQQVVWFVMFFATFVCGYLLAGLMPEGAGVQALVAGVGVLATAGALFAGSQVMSRDLSR